MKKKKVGRVLHGALEVIGVIAVAYALFLAGPELMERWDRLKMSGPDLVKMWNQARAVLYDEDWFDDSIREG